MTVPWLMNCAHSDEGWCLDCVAEMGNERLEMLDALEEVEKGNIDVSGTAVIFGYPEADGVMGKVRRAIAKVKGVPSTDRARKE